MSGAWRVTVDSWISDGAQWYGTTEYVVSGEHVHSLPAALQAIAESPPEIYLAPVGEGRTGTGRPPRKFTVPVCTHGRGCGHDVELPNGVIWCEGPEVPR